MRQTRKAEREVRTHASEGRNHARTELFLRGIPRASTLLPVGGGFFARRRLIRLSWPWFGSILAR